MLRASLKSLAGHKLRLALSAVAVILGIAFVAIGLRWNPQLGNFLAYAVAVATGYVMHSRWSFRDHGGERGGGTLARFVTVSLISLGLNSFWVWLLTEPFRLSPAWPIAPMLFVTPLVTFTLNRQWVFR